MSEHLETLFDELADEDGVTDFGRMTDDWLGTVRQRVLSGELPKGLVTTDPIRALNVLNRNELQARYISGRRRLRGIVARAFVPATPLARNGLWTRPSTDEAAATEHAEVRFRQSLSIAVRLHGGTLVALGKATWQDIEEHGLEQVRQTCREAAEEQARQQEAVKELVPA